MNQSNLETLSLIAEVAPNAKCFESFMTKRLHVMVLDTHEEAYFHWFIETTKRNHWHVWNVRVVHTDRSGEQSCAVYWMKGYERFDDMWADMKRKMKEAQEGFWPDGFGYTGVRVPGRVL